MFLLTIIVNLVVNHTAANSPLIFNDRPYRFIVFIFIYSFTLYYYIVYGILTLCEKRFSDDYRGTSGNFSGHKGFLSIVINFLFFLVFLILPPLHSTGMVPMALPSSFIWGIPGFLVESGTKKCADSMARTAAGRSYHPEKESLREISEKGYLIQVNNAVFDQRGDVLIHFDIHHLQHHAISASRVFRFSNKGAPDRSYSIPSGYTTNDRVLPLPEDRFLYYPDHGKNGNLPVILSEKGGKLDVMIGGVRELKGPWVLDRNTILGINGTSIVKIRLPAAMRKGLLLEAKQFINMKDIRVPGYHIDSFTFRPAADGRIFCALDLESDTPTTPGIALLATFSPSGRLLSKRPVSGTFMHNFDYGACVDAAGGLLYVQSPGGGDSVARIRPDGIKDTEFNERFLSTCGYFYAIMSIASDREGRILVAGRSSPGNRAAVLLVDRGGRKIGAIY